MKIILIGSDSGGNRATDDELAHNINYDSCQHFSDHRQLCGIKGLIFQSSNF
jgi:hypothetical protein